MQYIFSVFDNRYISGPWHIGTEMHLVLGWLVHSWPSLSNGIRIWEVEMKDAWPDKMSEVCELL